MSLCTVSGDLLDYARADPEAERQIQPRQSDDHLMRGSKIGWICIGSARQRSLLKIVVTCPITSASIPFLNCRVACRPPG